MNEHVIAWHHARKTAISRIRDKSYAVYYGTRCRRDVTRIAVQYAIRRARSI